MAENCNECSIAWIRGSDYAEVSAYNGSTLKNRTLKLKEENPEDVKVIAINKDGSIFAHVPRKYVPNLRAPRKLTEEQRAELVERGKNMSKWKVTDVEETPDFDFDDKDEEISRIEGVSGRKVRDPQRESYQVHRTRRGKSGTHL